MSAVLPVNCRSSFRFAFAIGLLQYVLIAYFLCCFFGSRYMAAAGSSSGGVAIRYIRPVSWIIIHRIDDANKVYVYT